jgi:hypothetical protein
MGIEKHEFTLKAGKPQLGESVANSIVYPGVDPSDITLEDKFNPEYADIAHKVNALIRNRQGGTHKVKVSVVEIGPVKGTFVDVDGRNFFSTNTSRSSGARVTGLTKGLSG